MPSIRKLPGTDDRGHFSFFTTVAGVRRKFAFHWKDTQKKWYMDLFETDGTPIVQGVAVVSSGEPLRGRGIDFAQDVTILFAGKDYSTPDALGNTISVFIIE